MVSWKTRRGGRPCKGLFSRTLRLYGTCKGEVHKAWLRPSGMIKFEGKNFNSPSMAAAAARGGRNTNGWYFWKVKQGEDFVRLKQFRK